MKNKQINCEKCLDNYYCSNGKARASCVADGRRCNVNINVSLSSVIFIRINHNFHINTDLMAIIIIIIRHLKLYRRKYMWSAWWVCVCGWCSNSNFHQTQPHLNRTEMSVCVVRFLSPVASVWSEWLSTEKPHFMTNTKLLSLWCIDDERFDALIARKHANLR